jgi:hypothetical protein
MFRAKTNKRSTAKKNANVSGPITPIKTISAAPLPAVQLPVTPLPTDLSGNNVTSTDLTISTAPVFVEKPLIPVNQRNTTVVNTETFFSALLDAESKAAVHRPWLRIERGLRMRLLRVYVDKRTDLSQQERVDLLAALIDALDKKLLNSKSQITYNTDTGEIVEINALKIIHPTNSKTVFRIEPPNRSTKKVRRQTVGSDSE